MQTIQLTYPLNETEPIRRQVLAIGEFDGVHLGHAEVIRRAVTLAEKLHLPCSIMTFHPHPRQVLGQAKYVKLLTPLEEKLKQFERLGVQYTYMVAFDTDFMRVSPEQFVEQVLIPMKVDTVIVGFDFTFGYKGLGTPDTLCELAKGRFAVEVVRPFHQGGSKVSSTLIREHLAEGKVEQAARLLGRPYRLEGDVVHGHKRGRTIGFPTANIAVSSSYVLPMNGVYAVRVFTEGTVFNGVMNIGVKPTFADDESKPTVEAHLFDFSGDLYGKKAAVELISFIRAEQKFASVEQLIAQIQRDADLARSLFAEKA
ncbi:bifunctional riboflavin kinase/FAD synthetase [Paenibacillus hamazuiensis]|uniref:bifunctional riboflavin kinase/FAD synthetase n=1 Tax=Paenibacillus hamazuiensis TaxID=2936508 RepID=UPI00200C0590|nr:bifunctional riboflavin kinase/FAD synthetase [Paenibacillus hamazuiensis]